VKSETFAGRVTVINLWATFCRPCVDELPALQKLADAFAGAPDVAIITINTDPDIDRLTPWMTEHGHYFEVLLGERWSIEAGYRSLPTTLFIDPHGRIVFIKEGATDRLVEEFTWRIEALRLKPRRERKAVSATHR
jgi:thiol-disulfide isomerase/thioredoxin